MLICNWHQICSRVFAYVLVINASAEFLLEYAFSQTLTMGLILPTALLDNHTLTLRLTAVYFGLFLFKIKDDSNNTSLWLTDCEATLDNSRS